MCFLKVCGNSSGVASRRNAGELTDDELDQIQGKKDILIGKLQEKYGYAREDAEAEVNDFLEGIRV